MYNPPQDEYYNEWIELYNPTNQSISLSGWYLCDDRLLEGYIDHQDGEIHSANGLLIPSDDYALITDGGSGTLLYANLTVSPDLITLHVDRSSICGGLDNSGETIILSNGSIKIAVSAPYSKAGMGESMTYDSSWGANGNGYTLERINPSAEPNAENWGESLTIGGTPGFRNTLYMYGMNGSATTTTTITITTTTTITSTSSTISITSTSTTISTGTVPVTTSTMISITSTSITTTLSTSTILSETSTSTITASTSTTISETTTTISDTTTSTSTSTTTSTILPAEGSRYTNPPTREGEIICKPDGIQNYRETRIDCGGPCGPCPETTTVTTSIKTTVPATSVPTTSLTTTTPTTTTTISPAPGIMGRVITLSQKWGDEISIAAILLLLSITVYVLRRKGKGKRQKRKGQYSLSMV